MVKQVLLFLLAGIVCLVVGLVLFDRVIMPRVVKYGQEVEVPDVTEISLEEATNILQTRGLILSVERWQQTEQLLAGQIIFQRPDPFSQVKVGRHIYVVVSKGGKRCQQGGETL
jgi:beta-lactam-binding protein with PASTA domain